MRFGAWEEYVAVGQGSVDELSKLGIPANLLASSSSSSSSSILSTLASVNQRYRTPSGKRNHVHASVSPGDSTEEVVWEKNRAVWYKDGREHLRYTFSEGQDIVACCFARFNVERARPDWASESTTSKDRFSGFKRRSPQAWTHDSLTQPVHPPPPGSTSLVEQTTERYLLVFLHDIAFAYPPGGDRLVFRLPFRVRSVRPIDTGILVERAPEGPEVLLLGSAPTKPTLYSLAHVHEPFVPVATATTIDNLLLSPADRPAKALGRVAPIQDLDVALIGAGSLDNEERLVIMTNARTNTISVWAYAHLPKAEIDTLEGGEAVFDKSFDRKGKGRASSDTISTGMLNKSSSGRGKRSSILHPDKSSNPTASTRSHQGLMQDEADLISSISMIGGDKSVLVNALSAAGAVGGKEAEGRRTSMGRNEMSMAVDRMALGPGGAPEMDRDPSNGDSSLATTAEIAITKIWESQWKHGSDLSGAQTHLFDSRSIPERATLLAVHVPANSALMLLRISRTPSNTFAVEVSSSDLYESLACCRLLTVRPNVLDLVSVDRQGQWSLITANGHVQLLDLPSLPSRIVALESDSARTIIATREDGTRSRSRCRAVDDDLTLKCLQALGHVLPCEIIIDLWARLVESPTVFEDGFATMLKEWYDSDVAVPHRRQTILALHLVAEECKLKKSTTPRHSLLARLISSLLVRGENVDDRNWLDHYTRALGYICALFPF